MEQRPSTTIRRVGLYFGSFNPVHLGHLVIANHMLFMADLDEVWLVVTPSSPHKQGVDMIPEAHRLQMVKLALADHPKLKASSRLIAHCTSKNFTTASCEPASCSSV